MVWWKSRREGQHRNDEESPRRLVRDIGQEGGPHVARSDLFHEVEHVELLPGEAEQIEVDPRVKKAVEEDVEEDRSANEVVRLRFEYISERESKNMFYWLSLAVAIATALTVVSIVLEGTFWKSGTIFIFSTAWSAAMFLCLSIFSLQCFRRIQVTLNSRKKWSYHQKRTALLNNAIVVMTVAVLLLALGSNIYGQITKCNININVSIALFFPRRLLILLIFFLNNVLGLDHVVDQVDPTKLYMDSSHLVHIPHASVTLVLVILNVVEFGLDMSEDHSEVKNWHLRLLQCEAANYGIQCQIRGFDLAVMITTYAGIFVLFIMYVAILILALKRLSKLPWEEHRYSNVAVRLLAWTSLLMYCPLLLFGFVRIVTVKTYCDDFLHSLYGVQDELVLFAVWAALRAYLYAPKYTTYKGSAFR